MKITKQQLRKIIQEEAQAVLSEMGAEPEGDEEFEAYIKVADRYNPSPRVEAKLRKLAAHHHDAVIADSNNWAWVPRYLLPYLPEDDQFNPGPRTKSAHGRHQGGTRYKTGGGEETVYGHREDDEPWEGDPRDDYDYDYDDYDDPDDYDPHSDPDDPDEPYGGNPFKRIAAKRRRSRGYRR